FGKTGRRDARGRIIQPPLAGNERFGLIGFPEIILQRGSAAFDLPHAERARHDDRPHPATGKDEADDHRLHDDIGIEEQFQRIEPGRYGGGYGSNQRHAASFAIRKGLKAARQPAGWRHGRLLTSMKPTRTVASASLIVCGASNLNATCRKRTLAAPSSRTSVTIVTTSSSCAGRRYRTARSATA